MAAGERRRRWLRSLVAASAVGALGLGLAGCGGDAEAGQFSGTVLEKPFTVPDTDLTDTDGTPFSLAADTDAPLTLVFFGYTRCDDWCPAVLSHLASAMTRLDEHDLDRVQVVMVSSDPTYDTPEVLRDYLDGFDRSFVGLTGDLDTVQAVGSDLAVGIDRRDAGAHTTLIYGVDGSDEAPVYWDAETTSSEFAADIHSLLRDS